MYTHIYICTKTHKHTWRLLLVYFFVLTCAQIHAMINTWVSSKCLLCTALQHTAVYGITRHHIVKRCNTLQHTATHFNRLQYKVN